jgi:methanogenic corrinoid protein MtbC1
MIQRRFITMAKEEEIFDDLCNAIRAYDEEGAQKAAQKAIEQKADLIRGIKEMSTTLGEIGEKFHSGELFLPHLVLASDAMLAAVRIFEVHIPQEELARTKQGKVVIGTVEGDLHDVGLNIVSMSFLTSGFEVYNLGKDTSVEKFIEKAQQVNADIIGASALLTVTMSKQKDLVDEIKYRKLPFKVMVGGGPVTREWASEIGADGYGEDSQEAVESARTIMKTKGV